MQVGRDVSGSNDTLSPGIFRAHGHGTEFPPHFDTLKSYRWNGRRCDKQAGVHCGKESNVKRDHFFVGLPPMSATSGRQACVIHVRFDIRIVSAKLRLEPAPGRCGMEGR